MTIEVDGRIIDATIYGQPNTLQNRKWLLVSNGNSIHYEESLHAEEFNELAQKLKSNVLVFNYPGVGLSSGQPNRQAMVKAYQAMLAFLEDEQQGIGAKTIIGYGHSLGGAVQGGALKTWELKHGIKYVFVKSRTFSDLSTCVAKAGPQDSRIWRSLLAIASIGVKIFGWNMDNVASSKRLQAPEIILQTAGAWSSSSWLRGVPQAEWIADIFRQTDGVIHRDASLAKALLVDPNLDPNHLDYTLKKTFLPIPESHNGGIPANLNTYISQALNNS